MGSAEVRPGSETESEACQWTGVRSKSGLRVGRREVRKPRSGAFYSQLEPFPEPTMSSAPRLGSTDLLLLRSTVVRGVLLFRT